MGTGIESIFLRDPVIAIELCVLAFTLWYVAKLSLTPINSSSSRRSSIRNGLSAAGLDVYRFLSTKETDFLSGRRVGLLRAGLLSARGSGRKSWSFLGVGSFVALPKRSLRQQRIYHF